MSKKPKPADEVEVSQNEVENGEGATVETEVGQDPLDLDPAIKTYLDNALAQMAGDILRRVDERIDEVHRIVDERIAEIEQSLAALDPSAVAAQIESVATLVSTMEASGIVDITARLKAVEQRISHFV